MARNWDSILNNLQTSDVFEDTPVQASRWNTVLKSLEDSQPKKQITPIEVTKPKSFLSKADDIIRAGTAGAIDVVAKPISKGIGYLMGKNVDTSRDASSKVYGYDPNTTGTNAAYGIGNILGNLAPIAKAGTAAKAIGGAFGLGAAQSFGEGGGTKDILKGGLTNAAFVGVGMGTANLAAKTMSKLFPSMGSVGTQLTKDVAFGLGGTSATIPLTNADDLKSRYGESIAANILLGTLPKGIGKLLQNRNVATQAPTNTSSISNTSKFKTLEGKYTKKASNKAGTLTEEQLQQSGLPTFNSVLSTFRPNSIQMKPGETVNLTNGVKEPNQQTTPSVEPVKLDLPNTIPNRSEKARGFIQNSVLNSKVVPDTMKSNISSNIDTYEPITNEATWANALTEVNTNYTKAKDRFNSLNKLANEKDTALGEALIVKAIKNGDTATANAISSKLAEHLTDAGRAVQAARILTKITPEGMLLYANKQLNKNSEIIDRQITKETAKLKFNTALPQDRKALTEIINNIGKNNFSDTTTSNAFKEMLSKNNGKLDTKFTKMIKTNLQIFAEAEAKIAALSKKHGISEENVSNILKNITSKQLKPTKKDTLVGRITNDILNILKNEQGGVYLKAFQKDSKNIDKLANKHNTSSETVHKILNDMQLRPLQVSKSRTRNILVEREIAQIFKNVQGNLGDKMKAFEEFSAAKKVFEKEARMKLKHIEDIAKKYSFTEDETNQILQGTERAHRAINEDERKVEIAKVITLIANKIPASNGDKIKALQRISLLLNPKTIIRNVASNAIMGTAEDIASIPSTIADIAVSKITGKRTTTLPNYSAKLEGIKQGVNTIKRDYKLNIDTSNVGAQYDFAKTNVFKNKALNKLDKYTRYSLKAGDNPYYEASYNESLAQQKQLNNTDIVTPDMKLQAERTALYRTFQNANKFSQTLITIQQSLNNITGTKFGLGNLLIPFPKIPGSIAKAAWDYSPFGLAKAMSEAVKLKNNDVTFDQKAFVDSIGRSTTGTGIIMLAYKLAGAGLITSYLNKNKEVADIEKQTGKTPFSFKIDDKYYSFDWASPISIPLAIGADLYQKGATEKDTKDYIMKLVASPLNLFINKTVLNNLIGPLKGYDTAKGLYEQLASTPAQFIPTILDQISNVLDPIKRETGNSTLAQIQQKLPGLSDNLPAQINSAGQEVKQNNPLLSSILPTVSSDYKANQLQTELLRLNQATNKTDFMPNLPSKSIQYTDSKHKNATLELSDDEYVKYQQDIGQLTTQKLQDFINTANYSKYTDDAKAKALAKIVSRVNEQVKFKLLRDKNIAFRR